MVHISSLTDDFYQFDPDSHTLEGRRSRKRFRLGDRVKVEVGRVDVQKRMLDFRLVHSEPRAGGVSHEPPPRKRPKPKQIKKGRKKKNR